MREHASQGKKTTTGFSIPSLKHPIRGFGSESSAISRQAVPEIQPIHKPVTHDISRIPLRSPQAKLSISQPGDKYEQEADSVAQQVMQTMAQPVNRQSIQREALPEEEEELQMKSLDISTLQRQEMPEDEEELQMKSLDNSTLQRQEVPEDEEELQMKSMVQRQGEASMAAAPDLETSINQARGGGVAMADNIRQPMEQAFGADFSGVKVHTDGQSDQLNRSIQARAFTTGQDVFFRQGEYNPGSRGGQELLAHELTHVVQQNGGAVQRSAKTKGVNGITTATTKVSDSKVMTGLVQRGQNASKEKKVKEVKGKNWNKYMDLQNLDIQALPINTNNQVGHNLMITIQLNNRSQKTLRFTTPPPLEYFEDITKITTDDNGNRNTERESVDQYARRPDSNTFSLYNSTSRREEIAPGGTLTLRFLDPAQMTITQNYKSRTVRFRIGLKGSGQRLNHVQQLECDNNNIIQQQFA